ncbi:putative UDP-Glycosyltransferase superfamily protein [Hibiscus syriacus]|uniref:UDP-Glycosyltransferase superfamily protein n=1 Tax=Hibiscus syriacus TaxID=106335 RepID=A0A6A2YSY2_HIBSY|nr:putative UDP-Glycosyltransferase superfamily protein [Hibiscus syriacus]
MKRFEQHGSICGIEKLTSGSGECSDYSTVDVDKKLGNEVRNLSENCRVSCGWCVESWESIDGGSHSEESMVCRFAVLVAMTSLKVEDDNKGRIYDCLSKNTGVYAENDESTADEEKKLKVGIGKVYKGILSDQQQVAIKHIINDGNVETFVREVKSLSHIAHPNLVRLLGYCLSKEDCFLIYELCPNGNLAKWLFGKDKALSWIKRLEIAMGSAQGLRLNFHYLANEHSFGTKLRAQAIRLGLSKLMDNGEGYVSSEVRGTFGYVDPEYQNNHRVNSSGDVFSFGVVLLQILSGKKARILSVEEFADPKLEGEYSVEAFEITFKLALLCTSVKQQRPTMEQVVVSLEKALHISTSQNSSDPSGLNCSRSNDMKNEKMTVRDIIIIEYTRCSNV